MVHFELFEDNAGGLVLYIFRMDTLRRQQVGDPIAAFVNWEYDREGVLLDAIQSLGSDPTIYHEWDSPLEEVLIENYIEHDLPLMSLADAYQESLSRDSLVAFGTPEKWYVDKSRIGSSAARALSIKDI
jgi:hypothetical protein